MLTDTWAFDPHTVEGVFVELGDIDGYREAGAVLSDDETYRYLLWRVWDADRPPLTYVMCNPSLGRGTENDSTLSKCDSFARREGYGGMVVGNLFALRSKSPDDILSADDPIGPENDRFLAVIGSEAVTIVAAWGSVGQRFGRPEEVVEILDSDLYAFGVNTDGTPTHPSRLAYSNTLTPWHVDS